jgi:hypothetical protein
VKISEKSRNSITSVNEVYYHPQVNHESKEGNRNSDGKFEPVISVILTHLCGKSLPLADFKCASPAWSYHAISNTIHEAGQPRRAHPEFTKVKTGLRNGPNASEIF